MLLGRLKKTILLDSFKNKGDMWRGEGISHISPPGTALAQISQFSEAAGRSLDYNS